MTDQPPSQGEPVVEQRHREILEDAAYWAATHIAFPDADTPRSAPQWTDEQIVAYARRGYLAGYAAALAAAEAGRKECRWRELQPGDWETSCGHTFIITQQGGTLDGKFGFCPFKGCGGRLVVEEEK